MPHDLDRNGNCRSCGADSAEIQRQEKAVFADYNKKPFSHVCHLLVMEINCVRATIDKLKNEIASSAAPEGVQFVARHFLGQLQEKCTDIDLAIARLVNDG